MQNWGCAVKATALQDSSKNQNPKCYDIMQKKEAKHLMKPMNTTGNNVEYPSGLDNT